jgi:hypothetical protein
MDFRACDIRRKPGTEWRKLPCRGADSLGHLPAFVLQHVGDYHLGAFACEHPRRGRPHAGRRARNDGHLAR